MRSLGLGFESLRDKSNMFDRFYDMEEEKKNKKIYKKNKFTLPKLLEPLTKLGIIPLLPIEKNEK